MESPVLGQWSRKAQMLPVLGFHCRNRMGVEGGSSGRLVSGEDVYTGKCALGSEDGDDSLWTPAVFPRGPRSSWKTGVDWFTPLHLCVPKRCPGIPCEHCSQSLPCFPAVPSPTSSRVPLHPLATLTPLDAASLCLPEGLDRNFLGFPFPDCGQTFWLPLHVISRRNYMGFRSTEESTLLISWDLTAASGSQRAISKSKVIWFQKPLAN